MTQRSISVGLFMRISVLKRLTTIILCAVGGVFSLAIIVLTLSYVYSLDIPLPAGEKIQKVAFVNVNIVDAEAGAVIPNQTVLIQDQVIVDIGDNGAVSLSKNVERREMNGLYMLPGFWDMD